MPEPLTVTASEASRSFSRLLRVIREGRRVTITSRGKAVAEMGPASADPAEQERLRNAVEELKRHWATLEPKVIGPWTREELYDEVVR